MNLDLYEVLVFFSWFLSNDSKWKLRNKYIGKSLSNKEIHQLFSKVYQIFNDWPNNYMEFIDEISESSLKLEDDTSIENHFGYFYTAIYKHLDNENTKFIIKEYDEYLAKKWDGGYVAVLKKSSSKNLNKRFISTLEVWKLYGIPAETVKKYISNGILQGVIKKRGNATLILVEKKSVENYKQLFADTYSTEETSKIIGFYDRSIYELQKLGIIEAIKGPKVDGYPNWRYSKESVEGLLEDIHKKISTFTMKYEEKDLISFRVAIQTAGSFKFSWVRYWFRI